MMEEKEKKKLHNIGRYRKNIGKKIKINLYNIEQYHKNLKEHETLLLNEPEFKIFFENFNNFADESSKDGIRYFEIEYDKIHDNYVNRFNNFVKKKGYIVTKVNSTLIIKKNKVIYGYYC